MVPCSSIYNIANSYKLGLTTWLDKLQATGNLQLATCKLLATCNWKLETGNLQLATHILSLWQGGQAQQQQTYILSPLEQGTKNCGTWGPGRWVSWKENYRGVARHLWRLLRHSECYVIVTCDIITASVCDICNKCDVITTSQCHCKTNIAISS